MNAAQLEIIERHRAECEELSKKLDAARTNEELEFCLLAAETTAISHDGERKAWGLDKPSDELIRQAKAELARRTKAKNVQA